MYRQSSEIRAELQTISDQLEAITSADGFEEKASQDQLKEVASLSTKSKDLDNELQTSKTYEAAHADITARRGEDTEGVQPKLTKPAEPVMKMPARAISHKSKHFASNEDAYLSGKYIQHLNGDNRAGDFLAAQSVGTDADGGFTVPDPLSASLINLLETRGVARQHCRRVVMSAMTQAFPKLAGHATVMYPDESAAITESDVEFSKVTLTAKKIAALVKFSTEISEDSLISIVDTIVESIAYSVATAEDNNLFNGVASAINATGLKGDTGIAETTVASVAALDLADLTATTVAIGNPIVGAVNEWYMNPTLFHGPIRDLLNAAGGNTLAHIEGGQRPMLLGYPVNFVNVIPGASATTTQDLLIAFGDLSMAYYFGDRRSWSFKILNELYAVNDQVGVIGTERIDIASVNPEVLSKITIV